jgi:hypothetical protein
MLAHLKTWWAAHLTWIAALVSFMTPSMNALIAGHPKTTVTIAALWGLVLHAMQSPLASPAPTTGVGVKIGPVLLLALLLPFGAKAQTNVAPPPTFHFVAGGSAIGFNAGQGTQAGSLMYTGLQVTNTFTVTYEHLNIPSINANGNLAVVGYTRGLNVLLGKTLSSKLLFDPSNINVTFSAGGGTWSTTKSQIAETVGASISYPIPGTSAALQIIGYQYIHAPNVNGLVTRNQQVQSGLIVYF